MGRCFGTVKHKVSIRFLGLRRLDPHQGSALDLSGAYNIPRPPAMLSNDLRSLHILSKTRLSIPHLLGGGKILSVFCRGEENFLTLSLQENYIPPTHRKNDTSLKLILSNWDLKRVLHRLK